MRCFELVGMDVKKNIIFTSMPELGVPHGRDIYDYLKDCFRDDLYVIFLFSRSFITQMFVLPKPELRGQQIKNIAML